MTLTAREMGRRGGAALVPKYGRDHFVKLGHLKAEASRRQIFADPEAHRPRSRPRGGPAQAIRGAVELTATELGRLGGAAMVAKYGREHMLDIARRSKEATRRRILADPQAHLAHSRLGGGAKHADPGTVIRAGRKGGEATKAKLGREHYVRIARDAAAARKAARERSA